MKYSKTGKEKKTKEKKEIVCSHVFWLIKKQKEIVNSHLTKLKFYRWSKILTLPPKVRLA